MRSLRLLAVVLILLLPGMVRAEELLTYEKHVRPILKAHCFHCHGEEAKPKARLDLRLVRGMLQGGKSGPAIVAGKPAESLLWERIAADEMPPGKKKLSARERTILQTWIAQGARTARPEPEQVTGGHLWTEEERSFWSFQPIRRPVVPAVRHAGRVRNPIDAFLLEKLEAKQLAFGPEADRPTLIRRLSFDLLGLPPSPQEIDDFVQDSRPDAYERLVDRLLASPHYGERWARHWLDIAGYADSDGYSARDSERKYVYKYRDYLIRALNADRPWDELIREQLAGDEMLKPPYTNLSPADQDRLIATGFLRLAPDGTSDPGADQNQARNDTVVETLKIVSTSLLGLTVGCAQCHAHRYDPISHEDYYRLRAIFEPALDWKNWRPPSARLISLWTDAVRRQAAEVDGEIARLEKERLSAMQQLVKQVLGKELAQAPMDLHDKLRQAQATAVNQRSAEQKRLLQEYPRVNVTVGNVYLYEGKTVREITAKYQKLTEEVRARRPKEDYVHALTEVPGKVPATYLFARGDFNQPQQPQLPGELSLLAEQLGGPKIPARNPALPTTGRRLAYARHLTSGKHPLVARVLVNRIWLNHFGRGIVGTPGDFGALGERPSHPELLDFLADEFLRTGWKWKPLHRLIVTSTAYRQSSRRRPELEAVDPDNRLLGRMSVRRLEAEAVRDSILAISGKLNLQMFGPPVPVMPDEVGQVVLGVDTRDTAGRPTGKKVTLGAEEFRRSLYIQVRRTLPLSMLEPFDPATLNPNCEVRSVSTVALQSLLLLNNEFLVRQSEEFAQRVVRTAGGDEQAQVRLAWRLALGQEPTTEQVTAAISFRGRQSAHFAAQASGGRKPPVAQSGSPAPDNRALASFCHALLCSNGFLYVD